MCLFSHHLHIIRYAIGRSKVYHVGGGWGANNIVANYIQITHVIPIELDLYFERFLHEKRTSPQDFDIHFAWDEHEKIQKYIFKKCPKCHVAFLGTISTFNERATIRETGKVLDLPKNEIDNFTRPILPKRMRTNKVSPIKSWLHCISI